MFRIPKIILTLMLVCSVAWAGVDFDGTDDFADLGSTTNIPRGDNVTVYAAFIADANTGAVFSRNDSNAAVSEDWELRLTASGSDTKPQWFKKKQTFQEHHVVTSTNAYTLGTYMRVAASMNSGNTTCLMNVNGDATSGCSLSYNNNVNSASGVTIGAARNSASRTSYFNGRIYQLCVWNTALTATQLETLATARTKDICSMVSPSSLVTEFFMDDQPDADSADGDTFREFRNANNATGDNGANNTGLTWDAERIHSYP